MNFEHIPAMEKNKNKQEGLSEQVHSEFETSIGSNYNVVRKETPVKAKSEKNKGEPLNWPEPDDGSVKNEFTTLKETPKMDAKENG